MIQPKTFDEIYKDVLTSFRTHLGPQFDFRPGSTVSMLIDCIATQLANFQVSLQAQMAQQYYVYPDGTKGTNKPRDGQTYSTQDPSTGDITNWQYDGLQDQWCRVGGGRMAGGPGIPGASSTIFVNWEPESAQPKCECGSDKVGSPKHSKYCKKFDPSA